MAEGSGGGDAGRDAVAGRGLVECPQRGVVAGVEDSAEHGDADGAAGPERPAGSSARAAFMAAGSTVPRPAPTSVIQAAVRP
jgi:hypothetical protein